MSARVIDQTIAELQAILRGQQLAADGTAEQHDRWTRTAAMMLGTAVDALVSERDRADAAEEWQQKVAEAIGCGEKVPPYGWNIADAKSAAEYATGVARQANEHIECPVWCDECTRWEEPRTCEHCNGSGAGPGCASGAYEECEFCAGDGRTHNEESAEARIAKALDLVNDWRNSVTPFGRNFVVDVRDRLRELYAALDGEVAEADHAG